MLYYKLTKPIISRSLDHVRIGRVYQLLPACVRGIKKVFGFFSFFSTSRCRFAIVNILCLQRVSAFKRRPATPVWSATQLCHGPLFSHRSVWIVAGFGLIVAGLLDRFKVKAVDTHRRIYSPTSAAELSITQLFVFFCFFYYLIIYSLDTLRVTSSYYCNFYPTPVK